MECDCCTEKKKCTIYKYNHNTCNDCKNPTSNDCFYCMPITENTIVETENVCIKLYNFIRGFICMHCIVSNYCCNYIICIYNWIILL